jgi:hypothetical protein
MSEKNSNTDYVMDIPENMHLSEHEGGMEFSYRWFKAKYILAILLAPLFCYFLIRSEYVPGDFSELAMPSFILIAVCVIVCYYSLARLLNKTRILVSSDHIRVQHGPVPFSRNRAFDKKNVSQLYVTKHSVGHRYRMVITTFQINVILSDNQVVTLVKGLKKAAQGLFIEKKIESFFKIEDRHVEGEVEKKKF